MVIENKNTQILAELLLEHNFSVPEMAQYSLIQTAVLMSDFVLRTLQKQPALLQEWLVSPPMPNSVGNYAEKWQKIAINISTEEQLHHFLRLFRHQEMAALSYLQSNALVDPQFIFEHLSDLAETLILSARDWLFIQLCKAYGMPKNAQGERQELLILGMGKLGGRELNFSSDVDLIFTYPEGGQTDIADTLAHKPIENSQFFTRLGQRLIQALDQITPDGFVYRTDMRLRPFGESGALVLSFAAMEDYYQEQGRDWERYAMIKAKILGENLQNNHHRYLKSLLRPFVYRRYLDFSAIQSLREMKQKISREVVRRNLHNNIKLGAGGIREIEFIVQVFQMIRGGRDKILQQRSLLKVLPQLGELNLLNADQAESLEAAYLFLRYVENVLQAIDDRQTQTLPEDQAVQSQLIFAINQAKGANFDFAYKVKNINKERLEGKLNGWDDFLRLLAFHQANVQAIFVALIGEEGSSNGVESEKERRELAQWRDILHYQISFDDLASVLSDYPVAQSDYTVLFDLLEHTFQEWVKRSIGIRGREALRKLMPQVLDAVCQESDYLCLLPRLLKIIDKITTRTTYLELLLENEQIIPQLMLLCGKSVMVAEQIARYPMLLDEIIVLKSLTQVIELEQYSRILHDYLLRISEDDEEAIIDGLRQFKQSQLLRIACADILEVLPVMKISDHLTYLAQAIIKMVVEIAWKSLVQRFGLPDHLQIDSEIQEKGFAVIGYGKLGGIELGYNSDLDLVFLHNAPQEGETVGGKRSIPSHQFYLKLTQKINSIFNLNTSAGILYDIDMRLRPSGEAGLLVSTFNAYSQYQKQEAWTWETQALVRSRCVYGSEKLERLFEGIRQSVLVMPRVNTELQQSVKTMREKMYQHLAQVKQGQFHLKTDRGGIIDIEFIAQYLVLANADRFPQMAVWSDNVRIFETAIEYGILDVEKGKQLKRCYTTLRNKVHHLNLLGKESVVEADQFILERQFVAAMWQEILS